VLGAGEANNLRRRYSDLTERVKRRARTPEDRDRLLEQLKRLNPDEWIDDAAVRSAMTTIGADLGAIAAEVPGRRRGRRGGRRRAEAQSPGGPAASGPSGIIDEDGSQDASPGTHVDRPDSDSGARGDRHGDSVSDAAGGTTEPAADSEAADFLDDD
jgi:hypothetical protein